MPNLSFQVKMESVELSKTQISQMQREINAAVANVLAKQGAGNQIWGSKLELRPEWYGIWLRQFASIDALKKNGGFKQQKFGL